MDLEKQNGENPEELETVAQEETAPQQTENDEIVVEITMEEEPEQEAAEEAAPVEAEETVPEKKPLFAGLREKAAALLEKTKPVKEAPAEEPEEIRNEQEEEAEVPAEEVPEEPVPVRRKPADAFNIDFPVEGEETALEETAVEETVAEEAAEQTEEAAAEAQEETKAPAKKPIKPFVLGLLLGCCVVLVGLLVFFVLRGAGIDLGPRENDVYYKASYTADDKALAKKADTVVASIGDRELTVSELQLYYINAIYSFYSQNYYYMSMMGLDLSAPLDEQYYSPEDNTTWEQYFLEAALSNWQSYTTVEMLAQQEGFTVSPAMQVQIDGMAQQVNEIAAAYGFESAEAYLNEEMSPGLSVDTYVNFNRVYCICNEYVSYCYEEQYPDHNEISVYYRDNRDVFEANGVTRDMGLISSVRHILIQPQGGVTDESGTTTYSEEEWATALSEAERILNQWNEGEATEESFAALANTYSADGGSNTTGGLYEEIHIDSSYVPEFKNWAIDVARKSGDTEIVKTTFGYHIMYFVSGENYFDKIVGEQLIAQRIQDKIAQLQEQYPVEVNYKKILLCEEPMA